MVRQDLQVDTPEREEDISPSAMKTNALEHNKITKYEYANKATRYHINRYRRIVSLCFAVEHYIYIKYGSGPAPVPVEEMWKQPTKTALA